MDVRQRTRRRAPWVPVDGPLGLALLLAVPVALAAGGAFVAFASFAATYMGAGATDRPSGLGWFVLGGTAFVFLGLWMAGDRCVAWAAEHGRPGFYDVTVGALVVLAIALVAFMLESFIAVFVV